MWCQKMVIEYRVEAEEEGLKLGAFLRRRGLSSTMLRRLKYLPEGLLAEGQPARTSRLLKSGEKICVTLPQEEAPLALAEEIPLELVYESRHALVLNKPAGLVMHPVRRHKSGTLANAFAYFMRGRAPVAFRPVGRLDGDTTGLVLCAMNALAAPVLLGSMQKHYLALVGGRLETDGMVDAPLGPAPGGTVLQQVQPEGRPSRTHYRVLAHAPSWSLLALRLETGRTHQIRVHMAHIGHPLLGDSLYGGDCSFLRRHALHSAALRFCEPQGSAVYLTAPLPSDMHCVLEKPPATWTDAGQMWPGLPKFQHNCIID